MIDAARDLFIAQGYRGVTLDAIIARAGGSRETIYRVFGGIAQTGSEMAQGVVEPIAPDLTPRVVLMRIGTELAKVWRSSEGRAINRMVISEGFDNPELVEAWYLGGPAPTLAVLEDYLNAQVTAGRLRRMEARLVARQFVSLVMCELAFPRSPRPCRKLCRTDPRGV
jgi:TetR/AcrR family transcriptional repressor of mexJK operon